jgi:glycerol kinase
VAGRGQIGGTAMETKVGDTVRSVLNGIEYKVKKIVKRMAVLESQDGKSQVLTELENLSLFYKKKKGKTL